MVRLVNQSVTVVAVAVASDVRALVVSVMLMVRVACRFVMARVLVVT